MPLELNPRRPPATWFARMFPKIAAGYPRKSGETIEHWKKEMSRITAGIWHSYPEATKQELTRRYERLATPAAALTNPLPCPVCGVKNPVSRSGLRLRCSGCGRQLISVKVKRK